MNFKFNQIPHQPKSDYLGKYTKFSNGDVVRYINKITFGTFSMDSNGNIIVSYDN